MHISLLTPQSLHEHVPFNLIEDWTSLDWVNPTRPTRRRIREALRLACLVSGARRGSRTYQHKLTLKRKLPGRAELGAWRLLALFADPERVARRIEEALPIPPRLSQLIRPGRWDVMLLPTMIHEDEAQNDLLKAAEAAGLPVLAALASWDTATTKGQFLVRPDRVAVWGPASALHMRDYHGFPERDLVVTGPPWFWPYTKLGARISQPYVLFVGTSVHYAPDEAEVVEQVKRTVSPVPLVYRPHPRRGGEWATDPAEARKTMEQVAGSSVIVTAFSTMIIEAALSGIPSAVLAFGRSVEGGGAFGSSQAAEAGLAHLSEYEHMANVIGQYGVSLARSPAELTETLERWKQATPDMNEMRSWALKIADVREDPRDRMVEAVRWAARR